MRELIIPRGPGFIPPPGLIRPSDSVQSLTLAANVPETFSVPSGADAVILTASADSYAHLFTAAEDDDIVTNGGFGADSDWTKGTGWTIGSGVADSDASQGGDSDLEQDASAIAGLSYLVTFTAANRTAGNVTPVVGGTEGTDRAGNATYAEVILAGSSDEGVVALRADLDWDGDVDDFSCVPCAGVPGSATNATGYASVPLLDKKPRAFHCDGIATISVISANTPVVVAEFFSLKG